VLLCSFLGGMRAITWTQVAQYVVILLAFLMPVSWLAYKQLGNPVAAAPTAQQLGKIAGWRAVAGLGRAGGAGGLPRRAEVLQRKLAACPSAGWSAQLAERLRSCAPSGNMAPS
jgi:cation/acetate symporter